MSTPPNSLLIEILSEELPPLNLEQNIGNSFSQSVYSQLNDFLAKPGNCTSFVSPRRFGCVIEGINYEEADATQLRKGPAVNTSLQNGSPTAALLGFAKSCGVEWQALEQRADGYFYFERGVKGKNLTNVIEDVINNALKSIQINKAMRWGDSDYQFVRPVHNLVVMLNDNVLHCQVLNLISGDTTRGHRFMSNQLIKLAAASEYFNQMKLQGKVIAEFKFRRDMIDEQLTKKASELGLTISQIDGLLDEVTALVEWPEVLVGSFDKKFLAVPQECLILSMAKNQKYFALVDTHGKLSNKFLFVANLSSSDPQVIIDGNQKVLSARLADAEFFYEFDQRTKLADFVPRLGNVVYHNKLGSQLGRVERLQKIAALIAPKLGVDAELASHTAYLLKADLVSEMVGEFPELQGIMGKYYALLSGEIAEVANSIEKHYYPRFSGDALPDSNLAIVVALADKLESLVGIWGRAGLIPSGDKDPYALRRAALGIVRILLVTPLDLKELLELTASAFDPFKQLPLFEGTVSEIYQFILQRLAGYLTSVEGYATKVVNAVLNSRDLEYSSVIPKKINYLPSLLSVLATFAENVNNQSLFQANKRIENILKKNVSELVGSQIDPALFSDPAEIALYQIYQEQLTDQAVNEWRNQQSWQAYFAALAGFNQPLDKFFAEIMVMAEDIKIRQNRLNLLNSLHKSFNAIVKLSELT